MIDWTLTLGWLIVFIGLALTAEQTSPVLWVVIGYGAGLVVSTQLTWGIRKNGIRK